MASGSIKNAPVVANTSSATSATGYINNPEIYVKYIGISSDTADTTVDNKKRTIKVDVKSKVLDSKQDKIESVFLQNQKVKVVTPEQFKLLKASKENKIELCGAKYDLSYSDSLRLIYTNVSGDKVKTITIDAITKQWELTETDIPAAKILETVVYKDNKLVFTFNDKSFIECSLEELLDSKQDKLIAGQGIKIENNVISVTGGGTSDQLIFSSRFEFPTIGELTKLYIATDEENIYRWNGNHYIVLTLNSISEDGERLLNGGEASSNYKIEQ